MYDPALSAGELVANLPALNISYYDNSYAQYIAYKDEVTWGPETFNDVGIGATFKEGNGFVEGNLEGLIGFAPATGTSVPPPPSPSPLSPPSPPS